MGRNEFSEGRERLSTLQIGRGAAVLGVVLFHAREKTDVFVGAVPDWLELILAKGYLGVDFFFILSGFIILTSHFDDPATLRSIKIFTLKRISRIYIPYWPVCAALIFSYLFLPSIRKVEVDWGWWTSILLIPSQHPSALTIAWTLVHEMLFYAIFVIFFVNRKIFLILIVFWIVAIFTTLFFSASFSPLISTLLNPINLEFIMGMTCALAYRKLGTRYGLPFAVAGAAMTILYFVLPAVSNNDRLLFGLASGLMVLGVALLQARISVYLPANLIRLGDASYSIYLVHPPIMSVTSRLAAKINLIDNWFGGLILSICCSLAVGWAYHYFFEKPALSAFRQRFLSTARPSKTSPIQHVA